MGAADGGSPLWVLGLAGVIAAGVIAFLVWDDSASTPLDSDPSLEADTEQDPTATDVAAPTTPAGPAEAGLDREGPGLPRVLPPDAAVEDIRDALSLEGAARSEELQRAVAAIGRLAIDGPAVLQGLRTYAASVEDARVRGCVLASLGTERNESHRVWLRTRMESAPTAEERLGALIALAHPPRTRKRMLPAPEEATASCLGGLRYTFVPLETDPRLLAAAHTLLDETPKGAATEVLPILRASIRSSSAWAELLTADGTTTRAWLRALPEELRAQVVREALQHETLSPKTRRVLEAGK